MKTCSVPGCDRKHLAKGLCHYHYYQGKTRETPKTKLCKVCGREFLGRHDARTCSPECAHKAMQVMTPGKLAALKGRMERRREALPEEKRYPRCKVYPGYCVECGAPYVKRRPPKEGRGYCTPRCANVARWRQKHSVSWLVYCARCGKPFSSPYPNGFRRCCSHTCLRALHKTGNGRHRARAAGNEVGRVNRRRVFDRCGWVCGVCGKPIDKGLKWPDPMAVSLDHIVAIVLGGAHTEDNCQAAHFACNSFKGAVEAIEARRGVAVSGVSTCAIPRG